MIRVKKEELRELTQHLLDEGVEFKKIAVFLRDSSRDGLNINEMWQKAGELLNKKGEKEMAKKENKKEKKAAKKGKEKEIEKKGKEKEIEKKGKEKKAEKRTKGERKKTITNLVRNLLERGVDYETAEKEVKKEFPESRFNRKHWSWYRNHFKELIS